MSRKKAREIVLCLVFEKEYQKDAGCVKLYQDLIELAEDSDDLIVRMFENNGCLTETAVTFGFDVAAVFLADMMENKLAGIPVAGNSVTLTLKPFEIVTLCVTPCHYEK